MQQPSRLMLAAATLALAASSAAYAQTPAPPMPPPSPESAVMTMPPMTPGAVATSAPATTAPSPSTSASPNRGTGTTRSTDTGSDAQGKIKTIKTGSLTRSQVVYGVTHQLQEAQQLAKMKTVNFDNLRVYRLPLSVKSMLKISDAESRSVALAMLGDGIQVAQTTPGLPASNGNNSPIQYLHNVLANINVSNALNNLNVLNNSNVNVNVALSNVLNNNKISIGQVVGLYIGGGGIITTITK
jgi:hypothetical protein